MKYIISILLFVSTLVFSQNSKKEDSYSILRLMVFNQKNEVLLIQNSNGWMTPATRHNNKLSINESLAKLAFDYGIDIAEPKLSGVFTFSFAYKSMSSFRSHYSARYTQGELMFPDYILDAKWFSIDKAIEKMSLPETKASLAIRDMTKQMLLNPETVWGGAFSLSKDANNKTIYKLVNDFYPLTNNKKPKATKLDNYTIQRLIIRNNKEEVLVYKGRDFWMTPALRHNENVSIKEGLENLAKSYGLKITQPKLGGLYTYKFDFKDGVSFRSFYTANVIGDDNITIPSPITQAKWIPVKDVLNVIGGLEIRKLMLQHVLEQPENLWGGSFFLYDDKNGKRSFKVLEDFYPLD